MITVCIWQVPCTTVVRIQPFYVYCRLLYYWCDMIICIYISYVYSIWKVSGCTNHWPILFFDSKGYFSAWKYDVMTCWPKCDVCVLEARILYV
jgi:hypothetical protein